MSNPVPEIRIRAVSGAPVRAEGEFVLYWMTAFRRARSNFALQRAVEWCRKLRRPLVVLEALRCDYEWASDRLHRFVLEGMADNRRDFARPGVAYYAYVEPQRHHGRGLLEALAQEASVVVADDFPSFFLPRMLAAAAKRLDVLVEAVDANGLLPLRAAPKVFLRAVDFRRFLQKNLGPHLLDLPEPNPLARIKLPPAPKLPRSITQRWPEASARLLSASAGELAQLPIDHSVTPAAFAGGSRAAEKCLKQFLTRKLDRYAEERNSVDDEATSGLSPYLHFGHISSADVFLGVAEREGWSPAKLSRVARGEREGWWGLSAAAEAFLDQLITWRELGYNLTWQRDDYDQYDSLPAWARKTLTDHERDKRAFKYSLTEFENATTHDELWNAAQRQLVRDGRMHNYLRMLWGKKILEWSATPRAALATMIELNNKYAVDGRNPNSYSGIFWVLGRYDRAWGPERPIFGKVRYMSSENTARKLNVRGFLKRYGEKSEVLKAGEESRTDESG